ncbi:MAG: tetratricopeptide repeat protein [Roseinatronobacter sp.]
MRGIALGLVCALGLALPAQAQLRAQDGLAALDAGDVAGAVAIWQPLAARGDAFAQVNLGVLALQGQGGLRPDQAEGFLTAAAEQGQAQAQMLLADQAIGRQDWANARRWFGAAAALGGAQAQLMAGLLADQGLGGPVDRVQAEAWFRASAETLPKAQLALGRLLTETGALSEAALWLERAALAGLPEAQFDLGTALADGAGLAPDPAAARGWYLRAARAGHAGAARNLSLMQARGQGGAQSFRAALAWAYLAGDEGADLVDALTEVMDADAQAAARVLSHSCRAPDLDPACE